MNLLASRTALLLSLLISITGLGVALYMQFYQDMKPCVLCLWARVPLVLIALDALVGFALMKYAPKIVPALLLSISLLFFIDAGISFFHIGVEQRWWQLSGGCPVMQMEGKTPQEALAALLMTPQSDCAEVQWKVLGTSITYWNLLLFMGMGVYTLLAGIKGWKEHATR